MNHIPKSTKVWKKLKKLDQEDKRPDLLPTVTRLGNAATAELLVPHTDQMGLDESLSIALQLPVPNLDIVEMLVALGANVNFQHNAFICAVAASNVDLVSLLVRAPKPVTARSITDALWNAVQAGSLEMVFLHGMFYADADDTSGKSLKVAV